MSRLTQQQMWTCVCGWKNRPFAEFCIKCKAKKVKR